MGIGHYTGLVWGIAHVPFPTSPDDEPLIEAVHRPDHGVQTWYESEDLWVGVPIFGTRGVWDDCEDLAYRAISLARLSTTFSAQIAAAQAKWALFRADVQAATGVDLGEGELILVADYD